MNQGQRRVLFWTLLVLAPFSGVLGGAVAAVQHGPFGFLCGAIVSATICVGAALYVRAGGKQ